MIYENILYTVEEGIAFVAVNRPKALNALNLETLRELRHAFEAARDDASVGVLVITGAGDKAFVAGADISRMPSMNRESASEFVWAGQDTFRILETMDKPVIAAVNGFALGGGTELAISCDFIYASTNAKFGQPEVKLGIIPGFGGTQRLPRLIGRNLAKELIYTGDIIDAVRAKEIGLVNAVFEPAALIDEVRKVARRIIAAGPVAVGLSKKAVNDGWHLSLDEGNKVEVDCFLASVETEDRVEGTTAFIEKRRPAFKGR